MFSRLFLLLFVFLTFGFFSIIQAATFTVTLGGDSTNGACDQFCTLREAINAANTNGAGADVINFNVNPAVAIIQPTSLLPIIKSSLVIDGTTQTGYFGAPIIVIDGAGANGFHIETPSPSQSLNVSILGLAINRFTSHGIYADCTNNCNLTIRGNRIGTNSSGLIDLGNGADGINIVETGGSTYLIGGAGTFEGNVISGNEDDGIEIHARDSSFPSGTGTATIVGNLIGVNAAGTAAIPNESVGIYAGESFHAVIGGASNASRNVISGNGSHGISLGGKAEIYKNYIGTNAAGTAALGNDGNGIFLFNSAVATIGGTITILNAPVDLGNVISGNGVSGIAVFTESPTEPYQIKRNRIGTNAAGDAAIANQQFGIFMGYPRHDFDSAARYRLGHERG